MIGFCDNSWINYTPWRLETPGIIIIYEVLFFITVLLIDTETKLARNLIRYSSLVFPSCSVNITFQFKFLTIHIVINCVKECKLWYLHCVSYCTLNIITCMYVIMAYCMLLKYLATLQEGVRRYCMKCSGSTHTIEGAAVAPSLVSAWHYL